MPRQTTYSEELQDIMGRIPGWVIRWGVTVIFIIFLSVVGLSFFVKYPDVVEAPIMLTTVNPPADLIAKSSGKIERFLVKDNEPVYKDSIIAVIFNTANYRDVLSLDAQLETFGEEWERYMAPAFTGQHLSMGELQPYLSQFVKSCKSYKHYLDMAYVPKKRQMLREQIDIQKKNHGNLLLQMEIMEQEAELEKNNLSSDSVLFSFRAIAVNDYQRSKQNMMQKQSSLLGQKSSIIQTEASILSNEGQLVELIIQYENEITDHMLQLTESRDQLLSQIKLWKDRYVLVSPIDGRISFTKYWSENQNISAGERLATVIPEDSAMIVGRMYIPSVSLGKVRAGQKVNVKLSGFPYMEYGILRGQLSSISAIPESSAASGVTGIISYAAEVRFPEGMISSYKTRFEFIQQMDGTGEIITEDIRLIERFFQPIKNIMKNN